MLSVERVKELINDPKLSDKEIEEIRDGMRLLVRVVYQKWKEEQNNKKQKYESTPK